MKAPSKIYAKIIAGTLYASREPNEVFGEDYPEYVRKDALLEWAKDNLLDCEASKDDADYGRIDAYKKLIDKINSL